VNLHRTFLFFVLQGILWTGRTIFVPPPQPLARDTSTFVWLWHHTQRRIARSIEQFLFSRHRSYHRAPPFYSTPFPSVFVRPHTPRALSFRRAMRRFVAASIAFRPTAISPALHSKHSLVTISQVLRFDPNLDQARNHGGIRGSYPQFFCAPLNFVVPRKISFKHRGEFSPLKCVLPQPPKLKTWLRAWPPDDKPSIVESWFEQIPGSFHISRPSPLLFLCWLANNLAFVTSTKARCDGILPMFVRCRSVGDRRPADEYAQGALRWLWGERFLVRSSKGTR